MSGGSGENEDASSFYSFCWYPTPWVLLDTTSRTWWLFCQRLVFPGKYKGEILTYHKTGEGGTAW